MKSTLLACALLIFGVTGCGGDETPTEPPNTEMSAYRLAPLSTNLQTSCTQIRIGFMIESTVSNAVPAGLKAIKATVVDPSTKQAYAGTSLLSAPFRQFIGPGDLTNWKDVLTGSTEVCVEPAVALRALEVQVVLEDGGIQHEMRAPVAAPA